MSLLNAAITLLRKKNAGPLKEGAVLAKAYRLDEKWEQKVELDPTKKEMFKNKSASELQTELQRLKDTGPHKQGTPEYEKTRQILFALRAKEGWDKKVKKNVTETQTPTSKPSDYGLWKNDVANKKVASKEKPKKKQ